MFLEQSREKNRHQTLSTFRQKNQSPDVKTAEPKIGKTDLKNPQIDQNLIKVLDYFKYNSITYRVWHDLDLQCEMIIFKWILTTLEASTIFLGSWGSTGNQLEPTNYEL